MVIERLITSESSPWKKNLKSYIEMSESESIRDLKEQIDDEVEDTYSPPDPGFWRTSQIESDDEKILDFETASKEKPFSRRPYINFGTQDGLPSKKQRLSSKRLKLMMLPQSSPFGSLKK